MDIYSARPEDAIFILEINSKTWLNTYESDEYWIDENLFKKNKTSREDREKFIKRKSKEILDNPWSYFIVKDKNNVIWYACWKILKEKSYNEFFAIYILSEYHWKWIWKILANKVFKHLWNKKDILVEVVWYNKKAISFYENLWFIFNKKLNDFEIIDWIWVPEIQMRKKSAYNEKNEQ